MGIVVDQSSWRHIAITGTDRTRFLNGMVTGNIETVPIGGWLRTLMLNHKARLLSMFDVHVYEDYSLLSCSPDLFSITFETLDRHIVMDDVELEERSHTMHVCWETSEDVWNARPSLSACEGATDETASEAAAECCRIEAGMPRFGVDVSDENFPFESLLVRYVDYEKGCFTGQEPVARVHARGGGGSKRLCGLRSLGDELLPLGASLATTEKPQGGKVSSVALSEQFGSIALAYVHKSAWEEGSIVRIGEQEARVVGLPFA